MAVVQATGSPTAKDVAYYKDTGELRNAAKEAALAELSHKLRRYAAFSYSEIDGRVVCTATVALSNLDIIGPTSAPNSASSGA